MSLNHRWRSVFYLGAGLNLLPFLGVYFLAKHRTESGEQTDNRIDWIGGVLFTAGSVLLFFCLSQALAEPKGWGTACESSPYPSSLLSFGSCLLSERHHCLTSYFVCAVGGRGRMGLSTREEDHVSAYHAYQYRYAESLQSRGRLSRRGEANTIDLALAHKLIF
jgi:hypothetical protein